MGRGVLEPGDYNSGYGGLVLKSRQKKEWIIDAALAETYAFRWK